MRKKGLIAIPRLYYITGLLALVILLGGCAYLAPTRLTPTPDFDSASAFVLRFQDARSENAQALIRDAIMAELKKSGELPSGYPQVGNYKRDSPTTIPPLQGGSCISDIGSPTVGDCLLLNEQGNFLYFFPVSLVGQRGFPLYAFILPVGADSSVDYNSTPAIVIVLPSENQSAFTLVFKIAHRALRNLGATPYYPTSEKQSE